MYKIIVQFIISVLIFFLGFASYYFLNSAVWLDKFGVRDAASVCFLLAGASLGLGAAIIYRIITKDY